MGSGSYRERSRSRTFRRLVATLAARLLTPLAHFWVLQQEEGILRDGRSLSRAELKYAGNIGISDPCRVRIQTVARIPLPAGWLLKRMARYSRVVLAEPVALTAGYGIYLCRGVEADAMVIRHELVHVGQFERLGRHGFLQQYFRDCLVDGYAASPLEKEARRLSACSIDDGACGLTDRPPEAIIRSERRP